MQGQLSVLPKIWHRFLGALSISFLLPLSAPAVTYTVTSTVDTDAAGTLRWAITQANASPGADTISFNNNLGTITLSSALPIITGAVAITGGTGNSVSGNNQFRILFVDTASSSDNVTISNLLLTNGLAKGGDGGVGGGGGGLGAGGAIFVNSGAVTLQGVNFANNAATGGTGGSGHVPNVGGPGGGGGGGLGGNGGAGSSRRGGGGGGGFGGNGGNANNGTGGGGGLIGDGGAGTTDEFGRAGGGGGGLTDGQDATANDQAGAGGVAGGGGGDFIVQAQSGSSYGGGGGGYVSGYNLGNPTGAVSNGGNGGKYGGGGGGSASAYYAHQAFAGNGGDFGGGGGLNGLTVNDQVAGDGGWGGGGGGGSNGVNTGDYTRPGDGGFGGGGGGGLYQDGFNGQSGLFGGDGGNGNGLIGGGGGGGALGGSIFVRSETGGSLTIVDSGIDGGTLTGGAGGYTTNFGAPTPAQSGRTSGGAMFLNGGTTTFSVTSGERTIYGSIGDASAEGGQAGALLKTGDGMLTLAGENTYTGTTTVSNFLLQIGNGGTTGSLASSAIVLENYANVTFNRSTASTYAGNISGQGYLGKMGAGTLTLTGNNTYDQGTSIYGGTLALESAGAIGTTGMIFITEGTLKFSAANTTDYSSRISSVNNQVLGIDTNGQNVTFASRLASPNGTLTKLGAGTLTLSGTADNVSLAAVVNGGTLLLAKASSASVHAIGGGSSTGDLIVNSSGTARIGGTGGDQIFNGATVQVNGGGTLDLNGRSEAFSALTGSGVVHNSAVSTPGTLTLGQDDSSSTFGGSMENGAGTLSLVKTGTGTLTLSGHNTYSGSTTVSGGTLRLTNTLYSGGASGALTVQSGAILDLQGPDIFGNHTANPNVRVTVESGALVTNGNFYNTFTDLALNGGELRASGGISSTWTAYQLKGTVTAGGSSASSITTTGAANSQIHLGNNTEGGFTTFQVADATSSSASDLVISAILQNGRAPNASSVASGLVKTGAGTLTLTGNNTYTGGTTLQAGTLSLGSTGALGSSGTISFTGGTLSFSAANTTDYSSRFANTSGQIYSIDTNGQNVTFASRVASQNGSLTKLGGGTLTFSGAVDNTALAVVVNDGAVLLAKDSSANVHAIGGGAPVANLIVNSGGTARFGGTGGDQIYFGATVQVNAGGILDLNGRSEGFARLNGTGTVQNSAAATTGILTLGEDNVSSILNAQLLNGSGSLALAKAGSGTLTLSGNNSYTGGTQVRAGTLIAATNNAAGTGAVHIQGGTFLVNAGVVVGNNVELSGGAYQRILSGNLAGAVNATSDFAGGHDTSVAILAGNSATQLTLTTSFSLTSSASNDGLRQSEVYSFSGTGSTLFVLQLSVAGLEDQAFLGWLDGDMWVNAVEGNTGNNALLSMQDFSGSFAEFQTLHSGLFLADYVGAYGYDEDEGAVWAVINHNSEFTVVPEPSTGVLLLLGLAGGLLFKRRRAAYEG